MIIDGTKLSAMATRAWEHSPHGNLSLANADGLAIRLFASDKPNLYSGWIVEYLRDGGIRSRRAVGYTICADFEEWGDAEQQLRDLFQFIILHFNKLAQPYPEGGAFPVPVVSPKGQSAFDVNHKIQEA